MPDKLTAERWREIAPLLEELLDLPVDRRAARLRAVGLESPELRQQLETLLEAEKRTGPLDAPGEVLATLMREIAEGDPAAVTAPDDERAAGDSSAPADSAAARFLPGTLLAGRYRIVTLLGRGGMGEVFRADDLKLGQTVALKFLPSELAADAALESRFLDEIKLARQVAHPNVCRVYDLGEAHGQPFLSMEFIQGEDLAALLKRIGRLPREKATQIAQQLCAGLAAAHAEGILHRDLKPANVMLDERGRVRITDFGLARLAATATGAEALEGTPAYMAPEQLAGQAASLRSDLYALGLVLYELYTGRRAFDAATPAELAHQRAESRPAAPSSHVDGLDPVVERAILRCLEHDPGERPASAREVAASLPGGDPLEAAIQAGETPSPELVAAAGPNRGLTPRAAVICLGLTALGLAVAAALHPGSSVVGLVPWTKPAAALAAGAREMLVDLGHADPPADSAWRFVHDPDYLRYLKRVDATPARWRPLELPGQLAYRFVYRQGGSILVPIGRTGRVNSAWPGSSGWDDPAPEESDILVVTDLSGRLRFLRALPGGPSPASATEADAAPLFAAAGLDLARFQPVAPPRPPPLFADEQFAWTGVLEEGGGLPVRVEAAFQGGRPVFFECVYPFRADWEPRPASAGDSEETGLERLGRLLWAVWILALVTVPGLLALLNLRSGRGDRRGAWRLAAVVFALRLGWWLLGGHHVPNFWGEYYLLGNALARSLFVAAATWVLYIAIEPHARRQWPRTLVSWSRLLHGRLGDPLVGRDLLIGVLFGLALVPMWRSLYFLVPQWLSWPDPPLPTPHPFWLFFAPQADPLLGARDAVAAVGSAVLAGLWCALTLLALLVGMLALLRRRWLAMAAFVVVMSFFHWAPVYSDYHWFGIAVGGYGAALFCLLIARFGVLATVAAAFTAMMFNAFAVTLDPAAPYFGTSLFALTVVAGVAVYGAWKAVGRPGPLAGPVLARR